jgi:alpha-tubulin suppressor-like RCC1 family protein
LAGGDVRCWGWNESGQLGDGTFADRITPTRVAGLSGVRDLAAGQSHTCALLQEGSARCWGANAAGQLADGTTAATQTRPRAVLTFP